LVLITVFRSEPVTPRRVTVRVSETLAETRGRVGVELSELAGERGERGFGLGRVRVGPGGTELAAHPQPLGLGEVIENVPLSLKTKSDVKGESGVGVPSSQGRVR
jgi:hypothetical protein